MYTVFVRNWWKEATTPGWTDNLEPDPSARKTVLRRDVGSIDEARSICKEYNDNNDPGRYSRKAEFTSGSI